LGDGSWDGERGHHCFLLSREALYTVGSPRADLRYFEADLADEEKGNAVQHGLEARAVAHPDRDDNQKDVPRRSQARGKKEKAMRKRSLTFSSKTRSKQIKGEKISETMNMPEPLARLRVQPERSVGRLKQRQ
jgi:hypothetical protein